MITLSMGFKKPETGDRGATVFTALEDNITKCNEIAERIDPKSTVRATVSLLPGSWVAVAGQTGSYSQVLTAPSGYTIDGSNIKFYRLAGSECHPTVTKLTSTTATVTIGNNTDSLVTLWS